MTAAVAKTTASGLGGAAWLTVAKEGRFVNRSSSAPRPGSQCIVLAVDAKEIDGKWKVHLVGGRVPTEIDLFDWVEEAVRLGAGEILFTSMDHDGTKNGFANRTLAELSRRVNVPIIASGGAGKPKDFADAFEIGLADAALAASVFHYGEIEIMDLKKELKEQGINMRI